MRERPLLSSGGAEDMRLVEPLSPELRDQRLRQHLAQLHALGPVSVAMIVHGKLTLKEILYDETMLYLVSSDLDMSEDELRKRLMKELANYHSVDDYIEDVLPYVPYDLRGVTVKKAREDDDYVALIVEWTDEDETSVRWTLRKEHGAKQVSAVFRFKWPTKPKTAKPKLTKTPKAKAAKVKRAKTPAAKSSTAKTMPAAQSPAEALPTMQQTNHKYQIAFTFAGDDRAIAQELADKLRAKGVTVFYDMYEQADLWGKNLYDYLADIYRNKARYCLLLISKHYAAKVWTNHERQAAQARAFEDNKEYILPVRLDDTEIPGLHPTIGYVDLRQVSTDQLVELVLRKLRAPN